MYFYSFRGLKSECIGYNFAENFNQIIITAPEGAQKQVNIMKTYSLDSKGVMEAGDHFKNGAILKSQTSRENKKSGVNM